MRASCYDKKFANFLVCSDQIPTLKIIIEMFATNKESSLTAIDSASLGAGNDAKD
jgi:hypothetical protein